VLSQTFIDPLTSQELRITMKTHDAYTWTKQELRRVTRWGVARVNEFVKSYMEICEGSKVCPLTKNRSAHYRLRTA